MPGAVVRRVFVLWASRSPASPSSTGAASSCPRSNSSTERCPRRCRSRSGRSAHAENSSNVIAGISSRSSPLHDNASARRRSDGWCFRGRPAFGRALRSLPRASLSASHRPSSPAPEARRLPFRAADNESSTEPYHRRQCSARSLPPSQAIDRQTSSQPPRCRLARQPDAPAPRFTFALGVLSPVAIIDWHS